MSRRRREVEDRRMAGRLHDDRQRETAGAGTDADPEGDADTAAEGQGSVDAGRRRDFETASEAAARQKRLEIETIEHSPTFRTIRERSRFDDLAVVEPRDGGRYGDVIRARARLDGERLGVALGLLDRPDDGEQASFTDELAANLARWRAVGDAAGVVTLYDWGRTPRPWVATEPVGPTLATRDRPDPSTALRWAVELADAVATLHRRGVVHAGVDPGNVVFQTDTIDAPRPLLHSVGLMEPVRKHLSPSAYLDPRYAAPEYFDRSFGGIDARTDVYHLGSVCYAIFTGRPPFTGSYEAVRAGALDGLPPSPTVLHTDLPDGVDDVVDRALAKEKLTRYETARQFCNDLRGVCRDAGFGRDLQ